MKEDSPMDLQKSYFDVLGLCCSSEVPLIEKILKPLEGVHHVSVIVPSRTVIVLHDAALISQFQIVKALNKARLEANVKIKGVQSYGKKWPSPYAVVCGVLLALSFLKYVYSPFKWLALGSVAVGVVPLTLKAIASLRNFRFDINVLMLIAVGGSIFLKDFWEAGTIVFLLVISEWLESRASHKATAVMSSLMNIAPQTAILADTGEEVNANEVKVNTRLAVKAGTMIPIDGIVVEGKCEVDEKTLTGESFPVVKQVDSIVYAGTLNLNGYISVKTTALAEACVVAKMAKLVEEAQNNKSKTQRYIDEFAKYYTPGVCVVAACLAAIPAAMRAHNLDKWYHLALVVLVSACPCALILSTPIAAFCALSKAATSGLLVKGAEYLEILSTVRCICFDKTGTITKGEFSVSSFQPIIDNDKLLYWVSSIESKSSHPMAAALVDYAQSHSVEPQPDNVEEFKDFPGEGIYGKIDGKDVFIGNQKIAVRAGCSQVPSEISNHGRSTGYIFLGTSHAGIFSLSDSCRIGVKEALEELKSMGIKTTMLTGDCQEAADYAQNQVGGALDMVYAGLLPQDKAKIIKEIQSGSPVAMVGDGLNDAPALATADIGISMGVSGSALANETGHVILMSNDIRKIPVAVRLARRTRRKIFQNIFIAMVIKAGVIALAIAGHPLVWAAVLADMGTCLLVIFNSMLLLRGVNARTMKKQSVCLRKDAQCSSDSKTQDKCCNEGSCPSEVKENCCDVGSCGSKVKEVKESCCDVGSCGSNVKEVKENCCEVGSCGSEVKEVKENCCEVGSCGSEVKEVNKNCCEVGSCGSKVKEVKDSCCDVGSCSSKVKEVKKNCCDVGSCGSKVKEVKDSCCDMGSCGSKVKKVKENCCDVGSCGSKVKEIKENCCDAGSCGSEVKENCCDVGSCGSKVKEVKDSCCDVVGYGLVVKDKCCDMGGGNCCSKVKDKCYDVSGYNLEVKDSCCDVGACGSKVKDNCCDMGDNRCGSDVKDKCWDVGVCGSKVKDNCCDLVDNRCGSDVRDKCCDVGSCSSQVKDRCCNVGGCGLEVKDKLSDMDGSCCRSKGKDNCCDVGRIGLDVKDTCFDVGDLFPDVKDKCCNVGGGGCGSKVKEKCCDEVGCCLDVKDKRCDVGECISKVKDNCCDVGSCDLKVKDKCCDGNNGSKVKDKYSDVDGFKVKNKSCDVGCCDLKAKDKCCDVGSLGLEAKDKCCDGGGCGSKVKDKCCDVDGVRVGLIVKEKCCDVVACGSKVKENCCDVGGCSSKVKDKCSDVGGGCFNSEDKEKCCDSGGSDLNIKDKCCDGSGCGLKVKDKCCDVSGGLNVKEKCCDVDGYGSDVKDKCYDMGTCVLKVKDKYCDVGGSGCGAEVKEKCCNVGGCGSRVQEVKPEVQSYKAKQSMQETGCCDVNKDLESQICENLVKNEGECNNHSYFTSEESENLTYKCCGYQSCGCLSEILIE